MILNLNQNEKLSVVGGFTEEEKQEIHEICIEANNREPKHMTDAEVLWRVAQGLVILAKISYGVYKAISWGKVKRD